ncbi:Endonuclease/exonuclease/phosphatase [Plectosphaerella plurivora]|uniref:Endonuclease/exonuclease/phosphatase n=1 Tax=Plectosphaerella plurivora TaxID=936078 RepID=A0A9P9AC67_9PEZI|nr:Endonuclease/exonuclease/phosphatase [Plectosphaerella plurivora]
MDPPPSEINILTLNCWGLKFISKLRNERITEIGRRIAAADPAPHIVAFQELFTQDDYRAVRRETRRTLPYAKFYNSGPFGGGLAILSRWPIEESTMFRYPLNGRPAAFWRGDWYVGKGVACAKIRYGPGRRDIIEVFNTHTHAPYEESYSCHRLAQSWEIAKLLRGACDRGHLALGLGDFNMRPGSLHHRIITAHAPVRDAWRVLHPDSSLGAADDPLERTRRRPIPTAEFNILENGATSDGPYCTWRWTPKQQKLLGKGEPCVVPPHVIDRKGKRLDYIFLGDGHRHISSDPDTGSTPAGGWVVKTAKVGMMDPHPTLGCSVSDHFSVEATIAFHVPDTTSRSRPLSSVLMSSHHHQDTDYSSAAAATTTALSTPKDGTFLTGAYLESPTASEHHLPDRLSLAQTNTHDGRNDNPSSADSLPTTAAGINPPQDPKLTRPTPPDLSLQLSAHPPASADNDPLPASTYDEILLSIHAYTARERRQQRQRSFHFFFWLLAWPAALAGIWFVPRNFIAFILLLIVPPGLVAGVIDGLMALLFFKTELRALREFEWEVTNAKAVAAGGASHDEDDEMGVDKAW